MIADIKEYMSLPKEERQKHLDLSTSCVERGGKANKGKPKSEDHKRKIAEAIRKKNLTKKAAEAKM